MSLPPSVSDGIADVKRAMALERFVDAACESLVIGTA